MADLTARTTYNGNRHTDDILFKAWQAIVLRAPDAATAAEDAAALGILAPLAAGRPVPAGLLGFGERKTAARDAS